MLWPERQAAEKRIPGQSATDRCRCWVIRRHGGCFDNVRFTPNSGHSTDALACPFSARKGRQRANFVVLVQSALFNQDDGLLNGSNHRGACHLMTSASGSSFCSIAMRSLTFTFRLPYFAGNSARRKCRLGMHLVAW